MKRIIVLFAACAMTIFVTSCGDDDVPTPPVATETIWSGATVSFVKADGAVPTLAENQDRLTDAVWISRGDDGQIYNLVSETVADKDNSPLGTEWAFGTTAELANLSFKPFRETVSNPKNAVGKELVLHLVEDDIYLDVIFTQWSVGSEGGQGGFAYDRSSE